MQQKKISFSDGLTTIILQKGIRKISLLLKESALILASF